MPNLSVVSASSRKPVLKKKQVASLVTGKSFVYICSHAACELDLVHNLLKIIFKRNVNAYIWEEQELRECLAESDPCLIIMSQPLRRREGVESNEAVWSAVREIFPAIPVVWLTPDEHQIQKFLPTNGSVTILATTPFDAVRKLIELVTKITKIKPSISF